MATKQNYIPEIKTVVIKPKSSEQNEHAEIVNFNLKKFYYWILNMFMLVEWDIMTSAHWEIQRFCYNNKLNTLCLYGVVLF